MFRLKKLTPILLCMVLLTGCWDFREVEHVNYINTVGIDYMEEKFVLYAQYINFSNLAKTEGGAPRETKPIYLQIGKGETLEDAGYEVYRSNQQMVSWEHVKTIVLSENVLKAGKMSQIDDFFSRFFQFRRKMWVYGTQDPLEDILNANAPLNISSLYTTLNNPQEIYKQSSRIRPIQYYRYSSELYEPGMTTRLPFLAMDPNNWKEKKKDFPVVMFAGYGYLHSLKYQGFQDREESRGIMWLEEKTNRYLLSAKEKEKPSVAVVLENPKVSTKVREEKGKLLFHVDVKLKGDIFLILKNYPVEKLEKITEQEVKKQIMNSYENGLQKGIDIFQLSQTAYRDDPELWKRYRKSDGIISLDKESLQLDVHVKLLTGGQLKKGLLKPSNKLNVKDIQD